MGERSQAYRRHQEQRAKQRAIRFLKICGFTVTPRQVALYARNRKPCSCGVCRNEKYRDNRPSSSEVSDE